jgi:hypothetical protein
MLNTWHGTDIAIPRIVAMGIVRKFPALEDIPGQVDSAAVALQSRYPDKRCGAQSRVLLPRMDSMLYIGFWSLELELVQRTVSSSTLACSSGF